MLRTLPRFESWIHDIAFSPSSQLIAYGGLSAGWFSTSGDVEVRAIQTGQLVMGIRTRKEVKSLSFSPSGDMLACGLDNADVELRNMKGTLLQTLKSGYRVHAANQVAFSPDGQMLACASDEVKLWHLRSGRVYHTVSGLYSMAWSLAFSPDGSMLASGYAGDTAPVILWDTQTGTLKKKLWADYASIIRKVAFSPTGASLASFCEGNGTWSSAVKVWHRGILSKG